MIYSRSYKHLKGFWALHSLSWTVSWTRVVSLLSQTPVRAADASEKFFSQTLYICFQFLLLHFHLKLPVLMDVEGFASSYTLKGQYFSMHTHVILKRRCIPKIFRTMFTLKWLGTSVSSLVFLKTPTIKESPITKVTPERSFSRMNLFMAPKGWAICKWLVTFRAFFWLFPCVSSDVVLQVAFDVKSFVAHWTFMG